MWTCKTMYRWTITRQQLTINGNRNLILEISMNKLLLNSSRLVKNERRFCCSLMKIKSKVPRFEGERFDSSVKLKISHFPWLAVEWKSFEMDSIQRATMAKAEEWAKYRKRVFYPIMKSSCCAYSLKLWSFIGYF